MSKAELGVKRLCLSCGGRFYDFKRSPIICPSCSAEFDPENPLKSRKSRTAAKAGGKFVVGAVDADDDVDVNDEELIASLTDDDSDDDIDFDDGIDVDNDDGTGAIQDALDDGDELLPNLRGKDE
jgi:uncharacterized protein (TIGR02300 family)